jgi:hypothetical protein
MLHTSNEPSGAVIAQTPVQSGPNVVLKPEWTVQMRSNSAHFSSCCLNDASLPLANISTMRTAK